MLPGHVAPAGGLQESSSRNLPSQHREGTPDTERLPHSAPCPIGLRILSVCFQLCLGPSRLLS